MTPKSKSILRTVLSVLLAAAFLAVAFRGINLVELAGTLGNLRYGWIALIIPVGLLSHFARALRWKYMLGHVKEGLSVRNLFAAVMIGYMVNNVLPRVGELVRPYVAGRLEGISKSTALGSVVVERIIDFVAVAFLLSLIMFASPSTLGVFFDDTDTLRPWFLGGSIVSLLLFIALFLKSEALVRSVRFFLAFVPQRSRPRVESFFDRFASGFRIASEPRHLWIIVTLSLVIWGLYAAGLYLPFYAYPDIASADPGFGGAVVLLALSSIAFIIPVPGAFGTYHSFLRFALARLYGIDDVVALSFAIVTHELNVILVSVTGAYFLVKDHLRITDVSASAMEEA